MLYTPLFLQLQLQCYNTAILHIPNYCSGVLPILHQDTFFMYCCLHPTAPGQVSELSYEEITYTSVIITWKPPKEPNGDIRAYIVEHGVYQNESTTSVTINARRTTHTVIQALSKLLLFLILIVARYRGTFISWCVATSHK